MFEPRAASGPEEVKIHVQNDEVMRTFKEYTKKECNENGGVKKNNLTAQQIVGKLKLQKRVRNEEIVIFPTDKSGKQRSTKKQPRFMWIKTLRSRGKLSRKLRPRLTDMSSN